MEFGLIQGKGRKGRRTSHAKILAARNRWFMPKNKTHFTCEACGAVSLQWAGRCTDCGGWNTLVEGRVPSKRSAGPRKPGNKSSMCLLADVAPQDSVRRLSTGQTELDRVLGGGVVPGAVILIGGDPGIGKSTLLLQVAAEIGSTGHYFT